MWSKKLRKIEKERDNELDLNIKEAHYIISKKKSKVSMKNNHVWERKFERNLKGIGELKRKKIEMMLQSWGKT